MSRTLRWLFIFLVAVAGLALSIAGAYAVERVVHAGQVMRNVMVGEAHLSGLGPQDARRALLQLEDQLVGTSATFHLNGDRFRLDPRTVGFDVEEDRGVAEALRRGRGGSLLDQFGWWVRRLQRPEVLALPASLDGEALALVLEDWEAEAIDNPPYPGGVVVRQGRPAPDYPQPGLGVDWSGAGQVVLRTLKSSGDRTAQLPVAVEQPPLSPEDVDAAVARAEELVADPVTLTNQDLEVEVTFSPQQLASALRSEVVTASDPQIELSFDPQQVEAILEPLRQQLELPPREAGFVVNEDGTVSVTPGRSGTEIDPAETAQELLKAARSALRTGRFPFVEGAEPELTTEEAKSLGIEAQVSAFTTWHDCCQPRVQNIHLIADIIDGAIVWPGEVFSVNDYVGQRTAQRGFLPAPVIYAGEFTEDVGGGVSQFATTFFNAVFFGGYEIIQHQPHSYYISRYPEGREATISWPQPDLVFRNDSQSGILIRTSYTDTSITVAFYGGSDRQVEAGLSDRYDYTDPPVDYVPNPALDPEQQKVLEEGYQGWSVTVYRNITYPDGRQVTQEWPVRYRPFPWVIEVHPCKIPPEEEGHTGEPCPQPPTTTTAPTGTTGPPPPTTVPPTTTTAGG